MNNLQTEPDDVVVRVHVLSTKVDIFIIGLKTLDYTLESTYSSVDDLPKWVQERLSLLMLISTKPPIPIVEGVGRRISENIFWVFPPEM